MKRIPVMIVIWLLLALGAASTVYAEEDLDPPHLVSMTFDPPIIDTSHGPATITATVRVTDDLSGAWDVALFFRKPGTTQAGQIEIRDGEGYGRIISGDMLDGEWQGSMTLPRYSAFGTWELYHIFMQDNVGNRIENHKPDGAQNDESWPNLFNGFVFAVSQFDPEPTPKSMLFFPLMTAR